MKKINYLIVVLIGLFAVTVKVNAQAIEVGAGSKQVSMESFDPEKIAGYHDDNIKAFCESTRPNVKANAVKNSDGTYTCFVEALSEGSVSIMYGAVDVNGDKVYAKKSIAITATNTSSTSGKGGEADTPSQKGDEQEPIDGDKLLVCDVNEGKEMLAALRIVGIVVNIIKVIVPILLIVFGMIDVSKAVIDSKSDMITKSLITFLKRAVAGVLIFFVPTLVKTIFNQIEGWKGLESEYHNCIECALGSDECPEVSFK